MFLSASNRIFKYTLTGCVTMNQRLVTVTLLLALSAWSSANETFCVSVDGQCDPSLGCVECQPLMWFVNRTRTIPNNSMIVFLPGEHSLKNDGNKTLFMDFYNKDNLQLIGKARTPAKKHTSFDLSPCCRIVCKGYAGFCFRSSSNIDIQWLTFEGCGASPHTSTLDFYISTNISLSHIEIKESKSYSLTVFEVCGGFVNITNSFFKRCMLPTCKYADNVQIWLVDCNANHLGPTSLLLASSTISFGSQRSELRGRGLFLYIHQPMVSVTVVGVTIANGSAKYGGNVDIYMSSNPSLKVQFINSWIVNGNAKHGGGLHIRIKPPVLYCGLSWRFNASNSQVSFINTTFQGNHARVKRGSGGGFSASQLGQIGLCYSLVKLSFVKCTFIHNYAKVGAAMLINQQKLPNYLLHTESQLLVILDNCSFSENHLLKYKDQGNGDGIVDTYSAMNIIIRNSVFSSNNGTALQLQHSTVLLEGKVKFMNNSAPYGAAIHVCETSLIFLKNGTHVLFENNTASIAGGAIYAGEQCLQRTPQCFYQPISTSSFEQLKKEMSLTFVNNNAALAGDAIYGGSVDHCFVSNLNDPFITANNINGALFRAIFTFHPNISSMVTSDPYGVCVCDPITGEPNCTMVQLPLGERFPGERFKVNVAAVGQTNGPVPARLTVDKTFRDSKLIIDNQNNLTKCQTITLILLAKPGTTENLTVSVVEANPAKENSNYYRIPKLTARVRMAPCPWVFQLNKSNGCDCNSIFESTGTRIQCDINTVSVQKPGYTWFSCIDGNWSCKELEGGTFRHGTKECKTFTQFNISDQCERGWGGRLCAHCASNYSLSLGFPTCVVTEEHCSVWKLVLLLFAFLLAGVLLVCFLAIFNLTVAEGTINGLVFFANCIHTYQNTFFHTEYESSTTSFFRVFIAWLNLDLGFQVCLYSGMTAYQKFWLECGFLFYLLLIGVVIVCLSDRYIWFTRLIGRNVVPVLSTVMLLAYPKLVRLSTRGLHCTKRNYWSTSNHIPFMWSEDETIDCFTGKHIPMLIVSLLMFIVATLYAVSLLLFQCLQRGSNWRVLRWVNKLRPFFDANTGSCRDQYRFWPGLLHLIRFCVFFEYAFLFTWKEKMLTLVAVCIFMFFLVLVFPRGVYKKWPLNLLEFWLFLCLVMTTSLYAVHGDRFSGDLATNISVGITAGIFVMILIHQTYKKARNTRKCKKFITWLQSKRNRPIPLTDDCVAVNEDAPLLRSQ